jgi:hypothetical protein
LKAKSSDPLATKIGVTPGLVLADHTTLYVRRPTVCRRPKTAVPYLFATATTVPNPCSYVSRPLARITSMTLTFGTWTIIGNCYSTGTSSSNGTAFGTPPTSTNVGSAGGSPCVFDGSDFGWYTANAYGNLSCGGAPFETAPGSLVYYIDLTTGLITITDGFSTPDIFSASLGTAPYDLSAPVILPNTIPSTAPYTAWLDQLTLTANT